jgi:ribosomal protein L15
MMQRGAEAAMIEWASRARGRGPRDGGSGGGDRVGRGRAGRHLRLLVAVEARNLRSLADELRRVTDPLFSGRRESGFAVRFMMG